MKTPAAHLCAMISVLTLFSLSSVRAQHPVTPVPEFALKVTSASGGVGELLTTRVLFDNPSSAAAQVWNCGRVASFSFGICHDESLATVLDVSNGDAVLTANGGASADFVMTNVVTGGWVAGVVVDFFNQNYLNYGSNHELFVASYERLLPVPVNLCPCAGLSQPPVDIRFQGGSCTDFLFLPTLLCGSLVDAGAEFRRGDVNHNGTLDIGDVVCIAQWLLGLDPADPCEDLADVDDNGFLQGIVDPIFLLTYLFQLGPPPPGANDCLQDSTADALRCPTYPGCP